MIVKPTELTFDLTYRNVIQDSLDFDHFEAIKFYVQELLEYINKHQSTMNLREIMQGALARMLKSNSMQEMAGVFASRGEAGASLFTTKIIAKGIPLTASRNKNLDEIECLQDFDCT